MISVIGYAHWRVVRPPRLNTPGGMRMNYKVLFAALKHDVTDRVVDAAKACGSPAATIVPGRGTGMHDAKTFSV